MRRALRYAARVNTALMILSMLVWGGMIFETVFIADFVVENRTTEIVWITPIGARGEEGTRGLLPVTIAGSPFHLPAFRYGDFRLNPGEAVTIYYDFDDVNLAEIAVRDARGRWKQIVVDPRPTADRYHAPQQQRFEVAGLNRLPPATEEGRKAIERADVRARFAIVVYALLFGPWILNGVLGAAWRRWGRADAGSALRAIDPCTGNTFRGD